MRPEFLGNRDIEKAIAKRQIERAARTEFDQVLALNRDIGGKTMSVTEATDAVPIAGYGTTSPSFRRIVISALMHRGAFTHLAGGQHRLE